MLNTSSPHGTRPPAFGGLVFLLLLAATQVYGADAPVDVKKIWDAGAHNAFTDLERFKGRWYCVFREGRDHVSPDGKIRVLESADGKAWAPAALLALPGADLRDPHVSFTPAGKLMIVGAAARPATGGGTTHRSMVWFSDDGRTWDAGTPIGEKDFWIWRVTWHEGAAYAIGYATRGEPIVRLYASRDGTHYDVLVPTLHKEGEPNEHDLVFLDDGTCLCLIRRDGGPRTGLLGSAKPPYREWTWKDLGKQIGGPALVRTPDGRFIAGVRLYDGKVRTSLCLIDPASGALKELVPLPSGGDTSYPGMVVHDGKLWVSYYASHEGKTSIYLAKVDLNAL